MVDGDTSGDLVLHQVASGGGAGKVVGPAAGGIAGEAFSSLSRSKSANSLAISTTARGGNGGWRRDTTGTAGNGASATAVTSAANGAGSTQAEALAAGGMGGFGEEGATGGAGGQAAATATARGNSASPAIALSDARGGAGAQGRRHGSALAHAEASGASGTATALAQSGAGFDAAEGIVRQVTASATAPVASASIAESRTAVSESAPDSALAEGLQSAAFATALPNDADTQAALAGNPNVAVNFDIGGSSDILGLVVLGGAYSENGSGTLQTYTSTADFDLDMTSLLDNSQDLLVGLLDPVALGTGFDALSFQIEVEGLTVLDETFTGVAQALTYFDDETLNLGDWAAMLSPDNVMDIGFMLSLTTNDVGAGFHTDFMFGNSTVIPIPPAVWLFGSGLLSLIGIARKREAN